MDNSTNQRAEHKPVVAACDTPAATTSKQTASRSANQAAIGQFDCRPVIGQPKSPQLPTLPPPPPASAQKVEQQQQQQHSAAAVTTDKRAGGLFNRILHINSGSKPASGHSANSSAKNRLSNPSSKGMGNVQQGHRVSLSNNSMTSQQSTGRGSGGGGSRFLAGSTNKSGGGGFTQANNNTKTPHSSNSSGASSAGARAVKNNNAAVNGKLAGGSSSVTQLQQQLQAKDALIDDLRSQLSASQLKFQNLERELDKVRSVLDQQLAEKWVTSPHGRTSSTATGGLSQSPSSPLQSASPPHSSPPLKPESPTASTSVPDGDPSTTELGQDATGLDLLQAPSLSNRTSLVDCAAPKFSEVDDLPPAAFLLQKRLGVSGESIKEPNKELQYHEKDAKARQQIREALRSNELLMNLDAVQLQEMVSCMHSESVAPNAYIIRENDDGQHLYVGAEGKFEVIKGSKRLCNLAAGSCFGELALLYHCKRTASVKALTPARVWVLERHCFQTIMMRTGMERIEERKAFLRSVPLLQNLSNDRIMRIADSLEAQYHSANDCIIRQGELADSFFIILSGKVSVKLQSSSSDAGDQESKIVRHLTRGEWFGEKALLGEGRRTASIYAEGPDGVEVLCLYRKDFIELIGDIQELKNTEYADQDGGSARAYTTTDGNQLARVKSDGQSTTKPPSSRGQAPADFTFCKLNAVSFTFGDIERVSTLGVGGFGRVDLVTLKNDRTKGFAMKRMQKAHIIQTHQQEHVHLEKNILATVASPFICKLYATYRDRKYVYMLMEVCLGGELWTLLRDSRRLDDRTTKFCLACSIEALDYLHKHGIIYRDLKPENLLVTDTGYIKLCDFGFAKYIGIGRKTWTFCGTPEYVAPEVILNQGHDFAADYWSLGILTYELLNGTPPFQAPEPIKIYMRTLKGIDALGLAQNKNLSMRALQFIRRLCRYNPSERLGLGKHGIQEIRNHKYFQGFDWNGVSKLSIASPFKVKLNGPLDCSNFDRFTMEEQDAPDEMSGWDANF